MKRFLFIGLTLLLFQSTFAQNFRQAVGIRGGYSSGFEYRAYANEFVSYKALLSFRHHGFQFTGMKELHQYELFDFSDDLVFIYGFGAHFGFEKWNAHNSNDPYYTPYYYETRTDPIAGLDGLAAVEYTLREVPISFGFEVKPYFDLFGKNFFHLNPFDFAFTIKYLF